MAEKIYNHPQIPEVLEAFNLLLNESIALDYCGITGKDRKLILNDSDFIRESKKLKAERYVEEIKDINTIIKSIGRTGVDENARFSDGDEDPTKIINLKMKATSMRREMLSLSADDKENDEANSLNIFFIDISREEFERMRNIEVHEGDENAKLVDEGKESPMEMTEKRKKQEKQLTSIPLELSRSAIEYINEEGDRVIEEVISE